MNPEHLTRLPNHQLREPFFIYFDIALFWADDSATIISLLLLKLCVGVIPVSAILTNSPSKGVGLPAMVGGVLT